MPELPDITVYVERLRDVALGQPLQGIRLANPFVLRTAEPHQRHEWPGQHLPREQRQQGLRHKPHKQLPGQHEPREQGLRHQPHKQLFGQHDQPGQHQQGEETTQPHHAYRHACLVIHGFAGGVHDVLPIAEFLSSKGWLVKCSKLPGHTGVNKDLATADYRDWLESVECDLGELVVAVENKRIAEDESAVDNDGVAVNQTAPRIDGAADSKEGASHDKDESRDKIIGSHRAALDNQAIANFLRPAKAGGAPRFVTVIGFSMGSLLAVNLATKYKADALVLLNTPIYNGNAKRIFLNFIGDLKTGKTSYVRRYVRRILKPPPVRALYNFRALLKETKSLLPTVTCPVFIGQSMKDDTVHPKSADFVLRNVSSTHKVIHRYPNSGHVICHESDAQGMLTDVWQFLNDLSTRST